MSNSRGAYFTTKNLGLILQVAFKLEYLFGKGRFLIFSIFLIFLGFVIDFKVDGCQSKLHAMLKQYTNKAQHRVLPFFKNLEPSLCSQIM